MTYECYPSVDELLAPKTLSGLIGETVRYVRCLPMAGGLSGSSLLKIEANSDRGVCHFVLKRMCLQQDWIMQASDDRDCRSVSVWQSGLLDRLRPTIRHAIRACALDGDGWAMLMDDVSDTLMSIPQYTDEQVYLLLDALSTIHATFWEAAELADPSLNLCSSHHLLELFTPATARRLAHIPNPIPQRLLDGWPLLPTFFTPDVVELLEHLYADPRPLCDALARYPRTLIHGDYRGMNLGIIWQPAPQTVILDWQLAGFNVATIDLAWFFAGPNVRFSSIAYDVGVEYYRQRLAEKLGTRFDESWWQPCLALGQLAHIVRRACFKVVSATDHPDEALRAMECKILASYNEQVREAMQWL